MSLTKTVLELLDIYNSGSRFIVMPESHDDELSLKIPVYPKKRVTGMTSSGTFPMSTHVRYKKLQSVEGNFKSLLLGAGL